MRMCCNVIRDVPFAFNAIFSFLFAYCSTAAFADVSLAADSALLPPKADDVGGALLLDFELGNGRGDETSRNVGSRISSDTSDGDKIIRKRDQSASNTAWFGPRLGRRRKRSLATDDFRHEQRQQRNDEETVGFTSADDDVLDQRTADGADNDDDIVIVQRQVRDDDVDNDDDNDVDDKVILKILRDSNRKGRLNDDEDERGTLFVQQYPFAFPIVVDRYVSKRQGMMKPRLGRRDGGGSDGIRSSAAAAVANAWDEDEKMLKAPPFSPRLGRRSSMPLKPRLGRAESAIFKPRLGRGPLPPSTAFHRSSNSNNIDNDDDFARYVHARSPQLRLDHKNH